MTRREEFEDLPDENFGALGGLGTAAFEKVTSKIALDGLHTACYCEYCGTKNEILSNWEEVMMGGMGYPAPNWYVDQGQLYPRVGCANPGCRREIGIRYAPQELGRYVDGAIGQGFLPPQRVQAFRAQVQQAAGARR
jgi:hypothetical protein